MRWAKPSAIAVFPTQAPQLTPDYSCGGTMLEPPGGHHPANYWVELAIFRLLCQIATKLFQSSIARLWVLVCYLLAPLTALIAASSFAVSTLKPLSNRRPTRSSSAKARVNVQQRCSHPAW